MDEKRIEAAAKAMYDAVLAGAGSADDFNSRPPEVRAIWLQAAHAAAPILSDDRVREKAQTLLDSAMYFDDARQLVSTRRFSDLESALAGDGKQASPVNMRQIEHEEYQVMRERDEFEDRLTVLAEAVGHHFDVPVGEWSNCNEPDKIALAILNGEYKTKFDKASPADAEAFAQAEREFSAGETVPEASVPEAQDVASWPESTCVECGKKMDAGIIRRCEYGGYCNWHIPFALAKHLDKLPSALAAAREHERGEWMRHDDYAALERRADALAEILQEFVVRAGPHDRTLTSPECLVCRANGALAAYEKGKQA